jgi:cell division septation protein DedD
LLVILALLLVVAFVFGYGAAWSVLAGEGQLGPTPVVVTPTPEVQDIEPTPTALVVATARPTATAAPRPTATPRLSPTRVPPTATPRPQETMTGFWVQLLAVRNDQALANARDEAERLGFPRANQRVLRTDVTGGGVLYKLRIGPFPNRESADRVAARMRESGFGDAWVISP